MWLWFKKKLRVMVMISVIYYICFTIRRGYSSQMWPQRKEFKKTHSERTPEHILCETNWRVQTGGGGPT